MKQTVVKVEWLDLRRSLQTLPFRSLYIDYKYIILFILKMSVLTLQIIIIQLGKSATLLGQS